MPSDTTSAAVPATLTENELFENFLHAPLLHCTVIDFLTGFEMDGLDEACARLIEECSDERYTSNPTGLLELALNEVRGLALNLERVISRFEDFKAEHDAGEDEADESSRYRVPASTEREAA